MQPARHCLFLGMLALAACQSEQPASGAASDVLQWSLPAKLREISGLALTSDQRLLAVADEEAIVYEIDYRNGSLVKAFAVGEPTVRGDFEGIAIVGDKVWLVDSDGRLFSFVEGNDGERVAYERINTGLADECEFEGLTADRESTRLLLLCKESRKKKKGLRIFEWLASGENNQQPVEIDLPDGKLGKSVGEKQVHPSGIAIDPVSGNRIVLAARERAVFELTADGELIGVIMRLDARRHQQPEGIAITGDGRLLIADEANSRPATLTSYSTTMREKTD